MNPAEKALGEAIQPAADAAELGEEVVTAFHRLTNSADARSALAPRRGLQVKAGGLGALLAGAIAVGAIGLSRGPAADIEFFPGLDRNRRRHDPRGERSLGVATVVGSPVDRTPIALDGKILRGSFDRFQDQKALRVLGAPSTNRALILGHVPISGGGKSHERPAAWRLIEELGLPGQLFTLDALHCQKNS